MKFPEWIGKTIYDLVKQLGEPIRKDPSPYGYEWWVYNDEQRYFLFGIKQKEIITVYAVGVELDLDFFRIGQSYEELNDKFHFSTNLTYETTASSFIFKLNEEDLLTRPIIKLDNDIFVQFYFDTFTKKLSSVRILNGDILLLHRDYDTEYRGTLPEHPKINTKAWSHIDKAMEMQIFEITNIVRLREGVKPVLWEEEVRDVAFQHSKDMLENNYFSHFALDGSGLKERLDEKNLYYLSAAENIAAQYPDAPAAVEGWLNSESHRETLLNEVYSHLGVGVYRLYYTQNFLEQTY